MISAQIYERHITLVKAKVKIEDLQTQRITKNMKNSKKNLCFISNLSKVNNQMIKVCIKVVKVYLKSQQKEKNTINSNMGGLLRGSFFGGGD